MTRRRLLQIALVALGAMVILISWRPAWLAGALARRLRPRLDSSSPTGLLSAQEIQTVVAFAEIVVGGRALAPVERGHVQEHIGERTQATPGYLALYRSTSVLLDSLAGGSFWALDRAGRAGIVSRHDLGNADVRIREYLWPFRRREQSVRALAVPDLVAGFYASPAGWALVGYTVFPGRPGDLVRYTKAEA